MFGTSEEKEFTTNWLLPFYNLVKVTGISFKEAKTGSIQFSLELEGKPEGKNFNGKDKIDGTKALGKLGEVKIGIYVSPDKNKFVRGLVESFAKMGIKMGVLDKMNPIFKSSFVPSDDGYEYKLKEETTEFMVNTFEALAKVLIEANQFIWVAITARMYKGNLYVDSLKAIQSKLATDENIFAIFVQSEKDGIGTTMDAEGRNITFTYTSEGKPKNAEKVKLSSKYWVANNEEDASDMDIDISNEMNIPEIDFSKISEEKDLPF